MANDRKLINDYESNLLGFITSFKTQLPKAAKNIENWHQFLYNQNIELSNIVARATSLGMPSDPKLKSQLERQAKALADIINTAYKQNFELRKENKARSVADLSKEVQDRVNDVEASMPSRRRPGR